METANPSLSFPSFIAGKKELKYLFFGGKGGVGKTALAGATAYYLSEKLGKKTLISSTNPVHSLSSLFGQDLWRKGTRKVEGTKNLYAVEIDISATIERYKGEIKERLVQFLKFADIPVDVEPFIEIATTNPSFEESAMFDDMVDLILNEKFDAYVFDTAPVAHTYRLLGMSKVYNLWLNKMIKGKALFPEGEDTSRIEEGPVANVAGWDEEEDGGGEKTPHRLGEDSILFCDLAARSSDRCD